MSVEQMRTSFGPSTQPGSFWVSMAKGTEVELAHGLTLA